MALELQTIRVPASAAPAGARSATFGFLTRDRVPERERLFFTEQLALLLETGANLYQALLALRQQATHAAMANVIDALIADVADGKPLSAALAKHPATFSAHYVNLVAASETGGFMHKVLYELKAMEAKRAELRSTLTSALAYPAFLMVFSVAVVIFVLVVVFPKFGDLFASIHDQLPVTTRALMKVSRVLIDYWVYVVLGIAGAATLVGRWITSSQGRASIDRLLLRAPFVGRICAEIYMVQVLRVMSLSLGNGVSMIDTLAACRDVVQNSVFRRFLDEVRRLVQEGGGLARAFEQSPLVPPIAKTMLSTAESAGRLDFVAARLADYYDQELKRRLQMVAKMAEPIMLVVMGGVVGLLVSSLILPIFKLSRAVH
jgi:type II secretory pathway component PulF